MAKQPPLAAIRSGFTIQARWDGTAYLTGRFPQSLDVREAKKLRTWLDRFITANERPTDDA